MAELIRMPFEMWTLEGRSNYVLDGVLIHARERAIWGHIPNTRHVLVNGWAVPTHDLSAMLPTSQCHSKFCRHENLPPAMHQPIAGLKDVK